MVDNHSEARGALAFPPLDDEAPERTSSPFWTRPTTYRRSTSLGSTQRPARTWHGRVLRKYKNTERAAWKQINKFTPLQQLAGAVLGIVAIVLGILLLIYNERIFAALEPFAKKWRDLPFGWLILWAATFVVSFPPLIGYSTCVTLAGFVYGFPNGWFIVASATIVGSTCSFLLSRYLFHGFVNRLIQNDSRFAALALTLKHDGIKLLVMIRLCPLPYSLSNGALSTIPTVTWQSFLLATAAVSPKLLLHVFVGAKLGDIAERGDKMDAKTKMVSYFSIGVGLLAGALTGWFIYRQTKQRAAELEQQERDGARSSSTDRLRAEYADDPAALEAAENLREEEDDISLRDAWDDDYSYDGEADDAAGARDVSPYRDESSMDEDAREVDDVFGDDEGPPQIKK